jgi:RNA polymerase sigma factor (sigma-70 family)
MPGEAWKRSPQWRKRIVSAELAKGNAPPGEEISRLAEHLFRHESGKLVSVLTGIFGIDRLQLAEDVVQEALIRAMETWPFYGVPKNPAAWLTQTAKNLALDLIRREKLFHDKQPQIIATIEQWSPDTIAGYLPLLDGEIKDGRLRLMFACCHSSLPIEAQTALALKTLCGFSPAEIATAFLTTEVAINKRLTRARQRIQELKLPFEIPSGEDLAPRLDAVMQVLYLLFNEGYKASAGENLVRDDLCFEALRLTTLLAEHPAGNQPRVHALLALMLLNAARAQARTDADGNILRLKDQDRALWNRELIARGFHHLGQSASGHEITAYHLEAGISACHCAAANYESTDWPQILSLYDRLVELDPSPIIALNRAVAVSQVHGPTAAIAAVENIRRKDLESYYLLYAVLGEFEQQRGEFNKAAAHLRQAIELTPLKSERTLLTQRLAECCV